MGRGGRLGREFCGRSAAMVDPGCAGVDEGLAGRHLLKGEGLCVIYLADGVAPAADVDMLAGMKAKFTSQLDGRGTTFKWMWMDMAVETEFKTLFSPDVLPSVVVFNPHKRLRFTKLEGDTKANAQSIRSLIDKIQGGDARFTMVKGQKLPKFADRKPAAAKKGKAEM